MNPKYKNIKSEMLIKLENISDDEVREEFTKKFKQIEQKSIKLGDKYFMINCKQLIYEIDYEIHKKPKNNNERPYNYLNPNNKFNKPDTTPMRMTYDNGIAVPEGMSINGKKMKKGALKHRGGPRRGGNP